LADREKGERFSEASIATVLRIAFDTLADNIETLIDTEDPQRQLVAEAAAAIAAGFSDSLSGGRLRDLLSTRQFIGIAQIVFKEVAKHPEHLLGDSTGDLKKTALSQIIASVAIALGENPAKLINGQGAVQLLHTALRVAVQNVDKLLDLESQDPRTNLLFQILDVIVTAAKETEDPRRLLTREVFQEVAGKILKVASNNLDVVLKGQTERIGQVLRVVMELSHGKIENRINGGNIASLMEGLLREVLLERLDLADLEAVTAVAKRDLLDT
jgi:hypothetical protein